MFVLLFPVSLPFPPSSVETDSFFSSTTRRTAGTLAVSKDSTSRRRGCRRTRPRSTPWRLLRITRISLLRVLPTRCVLRSSSFPLRLFSLLLAVPSLTRFLSQTVALWDLRNLKLKLHTFESHTEEVLQLAWSPTNETVFASASGDRRINLWDVSKIGLEQTPEDAEDGPPELMFVHGGHTSRPTDLTWSPHEEEEFTLATVAEDNVLQVWRPSQTLASRESEVDEIELE